MTQVALIHARAAVQAAGLSMTQDGTIQAQGVAVRRLHVSEGTHVSKEEFFSLVAWISRHHQDPAAFVAAYARQIDPDDFGILGLAIKTAPTLRASLKGFERYSRLVANSAEYRLEEGQGRAYLSIRSGAAPRTARGLRNECALAVAVQTMRCVVDSRLCIECVSFRHACSGDAERYARFFGCPVRFERSRDEIALQAHMLDLPNRLGDRAVCEFLTDHLEEEIGALQADTSLEARLLAHLAGTLESGVPTAETIAHTLGMSERTLYRRLAEEGVTYRDVLRKAQIALAQELLSESECSIAEIASRTGFSEQSTFSRAFKRGVGHTPARYRRQDIHV